MKSEERKRRKGGWTGAGGRLCLQRNASSNSIVVIAPEQVRKDSMYSLNNMKMEHVSMGLVGNLGRCSQEVHAASEM